MNSMYWVVSVIWVSSSLAAGKNIESGNNGTACGSFVSQLKAVNETSALILALGPERALGSLYTAYSREQNQLASELLPVLDQRRQKVDEALENISTWLVHDDDKDNPNVSTKDAFKRSLQEQRVVANVTTLTDSFLHFYTNRNAHFVRWISRVIDRSPDSAKGQNLTAYLLLIAAKEHFGIERGSGVYLFANGSMSAFGHLLNVGHGQQARGYLDLAGEFAPIVKEELRSRHVGSQLEKDLTAARGLLNANKRREKSVSDGKTWIDNATKFIELLHDMELLLLDGIVQNLRNGCGKAGQTSAA